MPTMDEVDKQIRPFFNINVSYVRQYLKGRGADVGCGGCPLITPVCEVYVDQSPQPLTLEVLADVIMRINYVPRFIRGDCLTSLVGESFDFIFSSHMLEDLENVDEMARCLNIWATSLKEGGHIVLILPDMEGGRYPKVGDPGGNPSHRVNVGPNLFMMEIFSKLHNLSLIQLDHIPHTSESFDIVLRRKS